MRYQQQLNFVNVAVCVWVAARLLVRSALCQTTCLLLPNSVLGPAPIHLDLLEQLLRTGCHLVAGRMTVLDETQRCHIAETLMLPSERDGKVRSGYLPCRRSLIVAQ